MTIQTLARRPTPETDWEQVDQSREEYHRQREVALRAYEEALAKPEAKTALAVRAAASASTSEQIGDIAAKWAAEHAAGQTVANVPVDDQAKVIFAIQAVRELAPERQKRLARRLGDVIALGADALRSMDIEDIRAKLTGQGLPIRRVRDSIFATRVYRAAIAAPASVDNPLKMLNLFAGIDAATYAASLIGDGKRIQTVAVAEIEPYPIAVMRRHNPQVPNLGDVTKIDWAAWQAANGEIDILTAGFPCQDLSRAGSGKGLKGAKSSLFREAMRAAASLKPRYIVLENVESLLDRKHRRDFIAVTRACRKAGYALDMAGLNAVDFGLPMLRPRWYAVGVRRDLARMLPKRKAWRYHDVAPEKSAVEMIDKGLLRRLGRDLDARRDIAKAIEEARRMRRTTAAERDAWRSAWIADHPGADPEKMPKAPAWVRIKGSRFSLLGGLLSACHIPQPSWLGDVLDREPSPSLDLDGEGLWEIQQKWDATARPRERVWTDANGEDCEDEGDGYQGALYELGDMRAAADRQEAIAKGKSNNPPLDLTGIKYPMAHGLAHTLWQRGLGYSLGGLGVRPHSMYTLTTHSGFGVVQEGRPRLLSHDEMDRLMGFTPGYSFVDKVDGKAPSHDARQKAIGNSMAVPCIGAALEGCLIAEMCLRGM